MNKLIVPGIIAGVINGIFWFAYSFTGSIVSSIGICFVMSISISLTLYGLGKRKNPKNYPINDF